MLSGDDQLVPLGVDTAVSVTHGRPAARQRDALMRFEALRDDRNRVVGAQLTRRATRTTVYEIKNNSVGGRAVPRLYVDHTADASKGGFEITSDVRRVKATVGWARFELSLGPGEAATLEVEEEAKYAVEITSDAQIKAFLDGEGSVVVGGADGASSPAPVDGLDAHVVGELRGLLR